MATRYRYDRKTTGIPPEVLNGAPPSQLSINERFGWTEGRITKRDEDRAYSLQGVFDVELAPIYGEGAAGERLKGEIKKLERCIQGLRQTGLLTLLHEQIECLSLLFLQCKMAATFTQRAASSAQDLQSFFDSFRRSSIVTLMLVFLG